MSKEEDKYEIPDIIYDTKGGISFKKGKFYGKGGFAKCYEIVDTSGGHSYAGKIVSKKLVIKESQREKMTQEIKIHQTMKHPQIVGFHRFFEDDKNIYILLELCKKRSMMELHKRRKMITEPETRFYMKQLLSGVQYLHSNNIIHRDLKLGNLFLNDELQVKIGDFGLAAKIEFAGERKKTLCGTPNYIAPEILTKKGHSFEVDVWSIGCIMYTLLIGKPPFETNTLKETYAKIKKCDYQLVVNISTHAKHMIALMLQSDPRARPKVSQLAQHDFLSGFTPASLPISCLTMAPRSDQILHKPLTQLNNGNVMIGSGDSATMSKLGEGMPDIPRFNPKDNFTTILRMLKSAIETKPARENKIYGDEMTDPEAQPFVWVSKWVDYSDKYGFGYQLCDDSVGVMFNDTTKLILLPNEINSHYIDKSGMESYMTVSNYPKQYDKKMKLLSYFSRYMREHLIKAGGSMARENDSLSRIPHLYQWLRSSTSVLMQLNNGTIQMNFSDHTKIILCPLMGAISYIDDDKSFRTFRFISIEKNGCSRKLYEKMRYAYEKISVLYQQEQSH